LGSSSQQISKRSHCADQSHRFSRWPPKPGDAAVAPAQFTQRLLAVVSGGRSWGRIKRNWTKAEASKKIEKLQQKTARQKWRRRGMLSSAWLA